MSQSIGNVRKPLIMGARSLFSPISGLRHSPETQKKVELAVDTSLTLLPAAAASNLSHSRSEEFWAARARKKSAGDKKGSDSPCSEDEASSGTSSPSFSPLPSSAVKSSPVAALCRVIASHDDDTSLSPSSLSAVTSGLKALKGKKDTPKKQERARAALRVGSQLSRTMFGSLKKRLSPGSMQQGFSKLHTNSWTLKINKTVQQVYAESHHKLPGTPPVNCLPMTFFNLEHLIIGDKAGGLHYAPMDDKRLVDVRCTFVSQKIFCAHYKDQKGKIKFSSLFNATEVTQQHLVSLISHERENIAHDNDRYLVKCSGENFLIETYESNGVGRSAFPVFYHAEFQYDRTFHIVQHVTSQTIHDSSTLTMPIATLVADYTNFSLTSAEVLNTAVALIKKNGTKEEGCIRYNIPGWKNGEDYLVVDIADAFYHETRVKTGIYFFIPTKILMGKKEIAHIVDYFTLPEDSD